MGHLAYSGLHHLSTRNIATGIPPLPLMSEFCDGCKMGKQTEEPYPKDSTHRATDILELLHSDVCGPLPFLSLGGGKYFLTITDDYSRKTWVFIMKTKGEAFSRFADFKAAIEKSTGKPVRALRTDRGGEFLSRAFQAYCRKEGIHRQLTVSYSPAQNGIAERKNRTLLERSRRMSIFRTVLGLQLLCNPPLPRYSQAVSPTAAHRILGYLRNTLDLGLFFAPDANVNLTGFTDTDWAGEPTGQRSTTGYLFKLGNSIISWSSKLQPSVALSFSEAEYRALMEGTKEAIWLNQLLKDLGLPHEAPVTIWCDNTSSLKMAENPVFHARTKHIETHYHFVREQVSQKTVNLVHIPTRQQLADILTKPLGPTRFQKLRDSLGVVSVKELN
ncbi:hypothetical protein R1sor_012540 [Riccia sorocarpa]|uniref:Integrase catalytic domain-containing protein n=1 Tax=Riccia sorocarpa TaxID=122646 RepID=A0ABD3IA90_9MARC